jgi:hypothetical protein
MALWRPENSAVSDSLLRAVLPKRVISDLRKVRNSLPIPKSSVDSFNPARKSGIRMIFGNFSGIMGQPYPGGCMKKRALFLHFFVGLGGIAGGFGAMAEPSGPMGMPLSVLRYSPFDSFFVPGLLLFSLVGVMNLISGILVLTNFRWRGYLPGFMGIVLMAWIVIQCVLLLGIHFLHVLYFVIGAVQFITGLGWLGEGGGKPKTADR